MKNSTREAIRDIKEFKKTIKLIDGRLDKIKNEFNVNDILDEVESKPKELYQPNHKLLILLDEILSFEGNAEIDPLIEAIFDSVESTLSLTQHTFNDLPELVTENIDPVAKMCYVVSYNALISDLNNILIPAREYTQTKEYVIMKSLIDKLFE